MRTKANVALDQSEAALTAASRVTARLSNLSKRLDVIEERLKALEDAINDGEIKTLRDEKDYIDGMFNMLNFNVDVAKKAKGRELNE